MHGSSHVQIKAVQIHAFSPDSRRSPRAEQERAKETKNSKNKVHPIDRTVIEVSTYKESRSKYGEDNHGYDIKGN